MQGDRHHGCNRRRQTPTQDAVQMEVYRHGQGQSQGRRQGRMQNRVQVDWHSARHGYCYQDVPIGY